MVPVFRALAAALLLSLLAVPAVASAADRAFTPRFSQNVRGDIAVAANTLMVCQASTACTTARNETTSGAANSINNGYFMVPVDVDASPATWNSSRAELAVPSGDAVLSATLYWGADLMGTVTTGTGADPSNNAPAPAAYDRVVLAGPDGEQHEVQAANVDEFTASNQRRYGAAADVTDLVKALGPGQYTVGNVQLAKGRDRYAGWSLVVAYADGGKPPRNLTVFDGYRSVSSGAIDIPVDGFRTPKTGPVQTKLGAVTYEGDLGTVGDVFELGSSSGSLTALGDAVNPTNNTFNASVSQLGARVTAGRDPSHPNLLGYDADVLQLSGVLQPNTTAAHLRLSTTGDVFYTAAVTFATDMFGPIMDLETSITDVNGGDVRAGDELEYTITGRNTGNDGATGVRVEDTLPPGLEIVDGSIATDAGPATGAPGDDLASYDPDTRKLDVKVGTGATPSTGGTVGVGETFTITFRVKVSPGAGHGATLEDAAVVRFDSQQDGDSYTKTTNSSITVSGPNLRLALARAGDLVRGTAVSYAIDVDNAGGSPTNAPVSVVDVLPAGLEPLAASGTGWDCAIDGQEVTCTRSDVLANGAAYPRVTVQARVRQSATGTLVNAATVTGGGDNVPGDNSANDSGTTLAVADLSLGLTPATATVAHGAEQTLTATIDNDGPSDATGVLVQLPVPAGFELVSATPSAGTCVLTDCAVGTLAAGGQATVELVVRATRAAAGSAPALTATAAAAEADSTPATDTATLTVPESRDVSVAAVVDPAPPVAGAHAKVTITARNDGPSPAAGVTLTAELPAALRDAVATALRKDDGCTITGTTLTCALDVLGDGGAAVVEVEGTVAPGAAGTALRVASSVTPVAADADTADDAHELAPAIEAAADLSLTVVASPAAVRAGRTATWTLRVRNDGPSDATGVVVRVPLPAGFAPKAGTGCAVAGGVLTCPVGALAAGATKDVELALGVAPGAVSPATPLKAALLAAEPDADAADAEQDLPATVVREAAVGVAVERVTGKPVAGAPLAFAATLRNDGPATATGVTLTVPLPKELRDAKVTVPGGTCAVAGGVATCTVAELPVGATVKATISGVLDPASAGAKVELQATAAAAEADATTADDSATTALVPTAAADLSVKPAGPTEVVPAGQDAGVRLTVHNEGPSTATGVEVRHTLPEEAEVVTLDPRCTLTGRELVCKLDALSPKTDVEFVIGVKARESIAAGALLAGVSVKGAEDDPDASNDAPAVTVGPKPVAPQPAAEQVPSADLIATPAPRACTSRRSFPIRLRVPRGQRMQSVVVRVGGKRVKTRRVHGRTVATVDLKGIEKRRVVVKITMKLRSGRTVTGTRAYRTCDLKLDGGRAPRL